MRESSIFRVIQSREEFVVPGSVWDNTAELFFEKKKKNLLNKSSLCKLKFAVVFHQPRLLDRRVEGRVGWKNRAEHDNYKMQKKIITHPSGSRGRQRVTGTTTVI